MENKRLLKGDLIDNKYEVLFFQTEVGNGQIYRCKDSSGRLVRLKISNAAKLKKQHFNDSGDMLELEILRKINHKNITRYLDHGEFRLGLDIYNYIVTEFLSGESLADRLRRENPLSPYSVLPIILDLLEAIGYLHSFEDPIIHNAITPENIFIDFKDKSEKAVLSNFHNARLFSYNFKNFKYESVPIYYRASETFTNVITPRSDLFSIGALFYNLIMSTPPWYQESTYKLNSEEELIDKLLEERAKPLTFSPLYSSSLDEHFKNVIRKALANEIDNRFQSASDFSKALKRETILNEVGFGKKTIGHKKKPVKPKAGRGFSAIAGMDELKEILYNDVILALNEPEKYAEFGLTIPNGLLLYGPPGCGKTFFAQKFAEEVGYTFVSIMPSDLASIYVHGTQEKIGELFKQARKNAPTIIFIDELDAFLPNRTDNIQHGEAAEVNEFLAQMTNCSEDGIFIIAASNRPEKIDPAVLRTGRIDKKFYLPPPDKKAREGLFRIFLKERPCEVDIDFSMLADKTQNYISSDIKYIVDESSRFALKANSRISMDVVLQVISGTNPSLRKKDLNEYDQLRNYWNEKDNPDEKKGKSSFGFILPDENPDKE